ncbi:MAG: hypothetical protein WD941_04900 [Opitutus sp.]
MGAVLTPLSNALEVKLTGTLQKPEWKFVMGPTSILRALGPDDRDSGQVAPPASTAAPVTPPPELKPATDGQPGERMVP